MAYGDDALSAAASLAVFMYFSFVKLPYSTLRCKCWRAEDAQLKRNSETTAADPTYCILSKSLPTKRMCIKSIV